jgi:hypothetical protein
MTSRLIGCVPAALPGVLEELMAKTSLLTAPSICMLLYRLFRPATLMTCSPPAESWLRLTKGDVRA